MAEVDEVLLFYLGGFSLWKGKEILARLSFSPSLVVGIGREQSCCLLWGEFAATAGAQPCTASPTVSEPLLVRAATELGPY